MEYLVLLVIAGTVMVIMAGVTLTCKRIDEYCLIVDLRGKLLTRLARTRLGRMLGRMHIRLKDYVQALPVGAVEKQLKACEHCGSHEACDHYLEAEAGTDLPVPGYCPNREALDRVRGK
jgi:hypothetical protein